jgi:hypothetical protein
MLRIKHATDLRQKRDLNRITLQNDHRIQQAVHEEQIENVRDECQDQIADTVDEIITNYDYRMRKELEELEQKLELEKNPMIALIDTAERNLKHFEVEYQKCKSKAGHYFTIMKRYDLLTEDDLRHANMDQLKISATLSRYLKILETKEADLKSIQQEISAVEKKLQEMMPSTRRAIPMLAAQPFSEEEEEEKEINDANDTPEVTELEVPSLQVPALEVPAAESPIQQEASQAILDSIDSWINKIEDLKKSQGRDLEVLEREKQKISAHWQLKMKSIKKLQNESKLGKLHTVQSRILDLATKAKKKPEMCNKEVTVQTKGLTLELLNLVARSSSFS